MMKMGMKNLSKIVEKEISEFVVSVINDGADALYISIYDDDGRDLSEDEEWLNCFLNRLQKYIQGTYPQEREWWAINTGKAEILLKLKNTLGIEIDEQEEKILEWLSNLF